MKSAEDLLLELSKETSIANFLRRNNKIFVNNNITIADFWKSACEKSNMSKSHIISASDFSYCYFYDVINGRKIPTADKIIRLALTMKLTLDDCQKALILSGKSALYPTIKRDSIIIYSLLNGLSVFQCSELLERFDESALK